MASHKITAHKVLAILPGLLFALATQAAEAASRVSTSNLQIPRIDVPRVVPHRAAPGEVRDPTIPAHRLKVVTPQRGPRGCRRGVTRNAPKGGPGIFALPTCGRAVRGPRPNDPPGCARFGEVRICP